MDNNEEVQVCCFEIGTQLMGVEISFVDEIIKNQALTGVPRSDEYVSGLTNLRGDILTVVDFDKIVDSSRSEDDNYNMMIIMDNGEHKMALRVDSVLDIIKVEKSNLEKLHTGPSDLKTKYFDGIYNYENKNILLINANSFLDLV